MRKNSKNQGDIVAKQPKEVTIKQMVKILLAKNQMNITELARASGRAQSTLSNMLGRGNPSLKVMNEIMEAMDDCLVLVSSDGAQYKIKFDEDSE